MRCINAPLGFVSSWVVEFGHSIDFVTCWSLCCSGQLAIAWHMHPPTLRPRHILAFAETRVRICCLGFTPVDCCNGVRTKCQTAVFLCAALRAQLTPTNSTLLFLLLAWFGQLCWLQLDDLSRAEEGRSMSKVEDKSKTEKGPGKPALKFLLWDITGLSEKLQFAVLACGVFFFFLLNSYLEEYLFRVIPEFKYGWYLTFFELLCFAAFAMMERTSGGEKAMARSAPLRGHFWVAAAMTASRGLTNESLQYLAYPTQVVFKSMKLITVMIASVVFLGRRYVGGEYLAAAMLVASAALFSLGDVDLAPDYNPYGECVDVSPWVARSCACLSGRLPTATPNHCVFFLKLSCPQCPSISNCPQE